MNGSVRASRIFILYSILCWSKLVCTSRTLLVNALGANAVDSADALRRVVETFDDVLLDGGESNWIASMSPRVLYTREDAFKVLPESLRTHITKSLLFEVSFYTSTPLYDRNMGRPFKIVEQISSLLESLIVTAKRGNDILALSYSNSSVPRPTKDASLALLPMERFGVDVMLLGKTRRLSSVSDWHDFQIIALGTANPKVL